MASVPNLFVCIVLYKNKINAKIQLFVLEILNIKLTSEVNYFSLDEVTMSFKLHFRERLVLFSAHDNR